MITNMVRLLPILALLCCPGLAADTRLDALQSTVTGMRGKPPDFGGPRGATPQLTTAKHQLRDWVESRLSALSERGDEDEFQRKLNSELGGAKLFCEYFPAPGQLQCPDWTLLGFLNPLRIHRAATFLIVMTSVGIECGFDDSAYVYSWSEEGWHRVWQNEQNTYTEKEYLPQSLDAVLISPYNRTNDYLVLTLGSEPWCSSAWHSVYYRAFRLGPDLQAGPLLDRARWAYLGTHNPPILGSIASDDVLVEYTVQSIDGGVHSREAVEHYKIGKKEVRRVDPFALRPRDFVDEWLNTDWQESWAWSEGTNRRSMIDWHRKLHKRPCFRQVRLSNHALPPDSRPLAGRR